MGRTSTIKEITKLYDLLDEIRSENERLMDKVNNGEASTRDLIKLDVYEHLMHKYRH